jgi:hypothetical protein
MNALLIRRKPFCPDAEGARVSLINPAQLHNPCRLSAVIKVLSLSVFPRSKGAGPVFVYRRLLTSYLLRSTGEKLRERVLQVSTEE